MRRSEGCAARKDALRVQGIVDHCLTGMVLSELTQEMDLVDYSRPSAKPCKRVASFRDTSLKDIPMFVCSFEGVFQIVSLMDAQLPSIKMKK
ncbi:ran-binding protein 17 isoform X1 [Taeniopygia guttata]|uniref:ran-binding protein 17 isoform X1 n=1 Tax=Taeniopygia guttata TaxID=59729 RepID=UPI003BB90DF1